MTPDWNKQVREALLAFIASKQRSRHIESMSRMLLILDWLKPWSDTAMRPSESLSPLSPAEAKPERSCKRKWKPP